MLPTVVCFLFELMLCLHSVYFQISTGKRVVILGASASAFDIMKELHSHAAEVIISLTERDGRCLASQYKAKVLPTNVKTAKFLNRVDGHKLTFTDGEVTETDVILVCTGYRYTFPFLDESCEVVIEGGYRITPLFKHMIHTKYHTLMFINMVSMPLEFSLPYLQIPFALKVLDGSLRLLEEKEMNAEADADYKARLSAGLKPYYAHKHVADPPYAPRNYCDDIAEFANLENVIRHKYKRLDAVFREMRKNVMTFRKFNYTDPELDIL